MAYRRTPDELTEILKEQIEFLRDDCKGYDDGKRSRAKKLATTVWILLHDGGQQKSLLRQLDLRSKLTLFSHVDRSFSEIFLPLMVISVPGEGGHFIPNHFELGHSQYPRKAMAFADWWEERVFMNADGFELSRKNLVTSLRNQDGGGHVDEKLSNDSYRWLTVKGTNSAKVPRSGGLTFAFSGDDVIGETIDLQRIGKMVGDPVKDAHLAVMRIVAFEIDMALRDLGL